MALGFTRREALCAGCALGVVGCSDSVDGGGDPIPPGGTTSPTLPHDTGTTVSSDGLPCEVAVVQAGAPGWFGFSFTDFPDLANSVQSVQIQRGTGTSSSPGSPRDGM